MNGVAIPPPARPLGIPGRIAVVGLVVFGAVVAVSSGWGLVWFIPYAAVGVLLVMRRPRTSIGWILLGLAWCFALVSAPLDATVQQFADGTIALQLALLAAATDKSGILAFFLFALLAIVFPSGRLADGRWGTVTRIALASGLLLMAATFVMPTIKASIIGHPESVVVRNPFALFPDLAIWQVVGPDETTFLPIMLLLVAAAISLIVRTRRATGIERQQLRWFAASIAATVVAVASGLVMSFIAPDLGVSGVAWVPAMVAFMIVPIAIGIAVLRYRLFEIDRIISRTIGYAVVTLTLVVVFAGAVVGLQAVLEPLTGGNTVAVAASTLIVAALFQPLRRRIQDVVDRRFDRARYDGERTVAAFAARLRDQVDLQSLEGELGDVVRRTVAPTSLGLWIQQPGSVK